MIYLKVAFDKFFVIVWYCIQIFYKNKSIMIDVIKQTVAQYVPLTEANWIFISAFDDKNILVLSNGVIATDKPISKVIEMIYHGLIESHGNKIKKIICDIVINTKIISTIEEIGKIDITTQWICISTTDKSKSGVLLPWTSGINSIQDALEMVKQKNHIEWNVIIYSFDSKKATINL